jgi:hypothetical protein
MVLPLLSKNKGDNMRRFIRNSLAGLLMMLPVSNALSQNNVERIQSRVPEHRFIRANIFYKLPLSIDGYSFTEYYDKGNAFFGKTTLSKDITKNLDARVRIEYGTGYNQSLAGIGIKTSGEKYFVSGHLLQGIRDNDQVIGLFASYNPHPKIKMSVFGDLSVKYGKWSYGELNILGNVYDKIWVGYNMGLQPDNKLIPALEHRLHLRIEL